MYLVPSIMMTMIILTRTGFLEASHSNTPNMQFNNILDTLLRLLKVSSSQNKKTPLPSQKEFGQNEGLAEIDLIRNQNNQLATGHVNQFTDCYGFCNSNAFCKAKYNLDWCSDCKSICNLFAKASQEPISTTHYTQLLQPNVNANLHMNLKQIYQDHKEERLNLCIKICGNKACAENDKCRPSGCPIKCLNIL